MMDISLALGGGGSKGNAHIGVLKVLQREGFRVRAIAGTSAGGLAAAAFAAGNSPAEIEARLKKLDQSKMFSRQSGDGPSLLGVSGVANALEDMLADRTFAELDIPCAVTSVDLKTGREVVLKEGKVIDAVLATIAIPGVFPSREWGEYRLADGGVLDPVPVAVARSLAPKLPVVAVVLSPAPKDWDEVTEHPLFSPPSVLEPISRLRVTQAFDIFLRSIDIGMRTIAELRLELDQPEVIIRPNVHHIGMLDRVDVTEVAKLGEIAAEEVLPELRRAAHWLGKLSRRFSRWKK